MHTISPNTSDRTVFVCVFCVYVCLCLSMSVYVRPSMGALIGWLGLGAAAGLREQLD